MWIAVGRLVLDHYGNTDATAKRRELEALSKELRREFNLSALEVADYDDPERCVFGFAAVLPETWVKHRCDEFLKKVCETIERTSAIRVVSEDLDLFSHGEV